MITHFLYLAGTIAGIAFLYYGAEFLIRGGVNIARNAKVSPLLIGLTLVAFGTSAPELVVSVHAALSNCGDISVGNVVGSNICNIGLILGLCALLRPIDVTQQIAKKDMPFLIGVSILFCVFYFIDGRGINRWQGGVFLLIISLYLWISFHSPDNKNDLEESAKKEGGKILGIWISIPLVIGGLFGLILGARLFVDGAVHFARWFGISEAIISLTIVAFGTSLPELATSVVAVFRNEKDIAVGNIVGSNIFNILTIMGVAPLLCPVAAPGIDGIDLAVMLGIAITLWAMMRIHYRISRWEGATLLIIYGGYVCHLACKARIF